MNDDRVYTLLRRLLRRKEEPLLGEVNYYAVDHAFDDAYCEADDVSKKTYEEELRELHRRGFLDIDLNGGHGYEMAIIHVTTDGLTWIYSRMKKPGLEG